MATYKVAGREENMENRIEKLLAEGKIVKYKDGIICGNCKKVSGRAGVDVNHFYIYPNETPNKQIEVCYNNTHYGYAHFGEDGLIYDNSNRSVFEILTNAEKER